MKHKLPLILTLADCWEDEDGNVHVELGFRDKFNTLIDYLAEREERELEQERKGRET